MKMTKFAIFSLAILFTFSLQAQDKGNTSTAPATMDKMEAPLRQGPSPEQRAAKMEERHQAMVEKLGLSEEQATAFKGINEKYRDQLKEARANAGEDRRANGQQMKAIRDAQKAELQAVLTPEQFEMLEAEQAAAKSERRGQPRQKRASQDGGNN
ncbi:MAG: hypothetical protein ACRBG0_23105 [Lewinella sp.]|uniref:hypothetical protein n=1 Tax=Lewinella sp. TaxID=2004506 RepID=UPI003D6AC590